MFTSFLSSSIFGMGIVIFLVNCNKSLFRVWFVFLRLVIEHAFPWENTVLNKFLFVSKLEICLTKSKQAKF